MPKRSGGRTHHDVGADFIDEYLVEIGKGNLVDSLLVGRVSNHFGSGRFQVTLYSNHMDMFPEKNCVLCGRLRARFNRGGGDTKIRMGSIVLAQNNGISGGREFEIVAVFKPEQLRILSGINKGLFDALTKVKGENDYGDIGFEFEEEVAEDEDEEIVIDNI